MGYTVSTVSQQFIKYLMTRKPLGFQISNESIILYKQELMRYMRSSACMFQFPEHFKQPIVFLPFLVVVLHNDFVVLMDTIFNVQGNLAQLFGRTIHILICFLLICFIWRGIITHSHCMYSGNSKTILPQFVLPRPIIDVTLLFLVCFIIDAIFSFMKKASHININVLFSFSTYNIF